MGGEAAGGPAADAADADRRGLVERAEEATGLEVAVAALQLNAPVGRELIADPAERRPAAALDLGQTPAERDARGVQVRRVGAHRFVVELVPAAIDADIEAVRRGRRHRRQVQEVERLSLRRRPSGENRGQGGSSQKRCFHMQSPLLP